MDDTQVEDLFAMLNFYPNIKSICEDLFGTVRLKKFIDDLLNDTNSGSREGFPLAVAEALMKIYEMNDMFIDKEMLEEYDKQSHESAFGNTIWGMPKHF